MIPFLHLGGSDDWAKGEAGIEYSYTVELPDTGRYGFVLPARYVDATVREAHRGMAAMVRELFFGGDDCKRPYSK